MVKKLFRSIGFVPVLFLLFVSVGLRGTAATATDPQTPASDAVALLERLGRDMAGFRTLKTEFVQEKHLAVFKNAVVLRGRIIIAKPDRIAWHVDAPVKYSVVISGSSVRQWDEDSDRVQEISLAKNLILKNALQQLTVWFSGSYASLVKDYDIAVMETSPYAFRFTPRKKAVASRVVKEIRVEFRNDHRYLRKISILERGGDSTDITFTDTLFDAPLEANDFEVKRRV